MGEASSALVGKPDMLQMALTTVIRNNPTVRGIFSQAVKNRIPVAPMLSVLGDRVQLVISVKDLVEDPIVSAAILAEAGGGLTTEDLTVLSPDAFQLVTLRSDLYETILAAVVAERSGWRILSILAAPEGEIEAVKERRKRTQR